MTSVMTATTDVVISEKSMLEFFRSDFNGIAVSRISTMRMGWLACQASKLNLRNVRLLDHPFPFGDVGLHIGGERGRRIALRHDAELEQPRFDVRRFDRRG